MANWYQDLRTENAAILTLTAIPHAEVARPTEPDPGYDFQVSFRGVPCEGMALAVTAKGVRTRPSEKRAFRLRLGPKNKGFVRDARVPVMLMVVYVPQAEVFVTWLKKPTGPDGLEVIGNGNDTFHLTKVTEPVLHEFAEAAKSFSLHKVA